MRVKKERRGKSFIGDVWKSLKTRNGGRDGMAIGFLAAMEEGDLVRLIP